MKVNQVVLQCSLTPEKDPLNEAKDIWLFYPTHGLCAARIGCRNSCSPRVKVMLVELGAIASHRVHHSEDVAK